MAPILESGSIIPPRDTIFVRDNGIVAFEDRPGYGSHNELAGKFRLGRPSSNRRKVLDLDGAGFMREEGGKIYLTGTTNGCNIPGDLDDSRKTDALIVGKITGKEVIY